MPAIRVRRNKNGTLTISGVPQYVIAHLITLAAIGAYDGLKEYAGTKEREYYVEILDLTKLLEAALRSVYWKPKPIPPLAQQSKERRAERVSDERNDRLELEKILKSMIAATRERKRKEQGHV